MKLKIKEIEENFFELEECLFKNYYPQDDFEDRNVKHIRNLCNGAFNQSINEDYYKPIRT